jgi:hypothetical protein
MGHLAEPTTSATVAGADIYHDIYPPLPTSSTPTSTPTAAPLSSGDVAAGRDGRRGRRFAGTYLFGYLKEEVVQRRPLNTAPRDIYHLYHVYHAYHGCRATHTAVRTAAATLGQSKCARD